MSTHAEFLAYNMWSAGTLSHARADVVDIEDSTWAPEPDAIPLPALWPVASREENDSEDPMTSVAYSPSFCSMASYGASSATPSSPGTDGDVESVLCLDVEASEYRFLGPPRNLADELAYVAVMEGFLSFGQVGILMGLLPVQKHGKRRYAQSDRLTFCFGTGAFIHGPHAGIRKHVADYPWCSVLLAALLRTHFPGRPFSSCVLQMNMTTQVHRDHHNDENVDNLVLACSRWEGGHLWLEDAEGGIFLENGMRGRALSVQPKAEFNGRIPHKSMPWTGCRTALVGFHIRDMWRLKAEDITVLQRMGFVLRCSAE